MRFTQTDHNGLPQFLKLPPGTPRTIRTPHIPESIWAKEHGCSDRCPKYDDWDLVEKPLSSESGKLLFVPDGSDFVWGWGYRRRAIPFKDYIPRGYHTKMIPAFDYAAFDTKEAARTHLEQSFAASGFQIDKIDFNKFGALVTFHSSSVLRQ